MRLHHEKWYVAFYEHVQSNRNSSVHAIKSNRRHFKPTKTDRPTVLNILKGRMEHFFVSVLGFREIHCSLLSSKTAPHNINLSSATHNFQVKYLWRWPVGFRGRTRNLHISWSPPFLCHICAPWWNVHLKMELLKTLSIVSRSDRHEFRTNLELHYRTWCPYLKYIYPPEIRVERSRVNGEFQTHIHVCTLWWNLWLSYMDLALCHCGSNWGDFMYKLTLGTNTMMRGSTHIHVPWDTGMQCTCVIR